MSRLLQYRQRKAKHAVQASNEQSVDNVINLLSCYLDLVKVAMKSFSNSVISLFWPLVMLRVIGVIGKHPGWHTAAYIY